MSRTTPRPPSPLGAALARFLRLEAASGVLLLAATAVALSWANSPWSAAYRRLWQAPHGAFGFERSLAWVVDDGLMVAFFFVVGLEIRRELHGGVLAGWRRAALPGAAALGGMLTPAALYLALAASPEARPGWGVPMATDIAFALGVVALLGRRVPPALRVLLLALAVLDDLGAIVVIALFYASGLHLEGALVAAAGLAALVALRRRGVRPRVAYLLPALVVWAGVGATGVHPTLAGVVVALALPAWASRGLLERLHPFVAYAVMPVFALANAGVSFGDAGWSPAAGEVASGVTVGLAVGKPAGVLLFSWLALRLGWAQRPEGLSARHLLVLGVVAGVGFTMSLFVAQLAFGDPALLAAAKVGVLVGSGVAAALALVLGRVLLPLPAEADGAPAEARTPDGTG